MKPSEFISELITFLIQILNGNIIYFPEGILSSIYFEDLKNLKIYFLVIIQ